LNVAKSVSEIRSILELVSMTAVYVFGASKSLP